MQIRLLGDIEIVGADGVIRELDGARPRRLLTLLAVRAGRAVPAEQLADELWEEHPPATAATALRVHVNTLRKTLEPDRAKAAPSRWLRNDDAGYRLAVGPDELDTLRFEAGVAGARRNADAGDLLAAIDGYVAALAEWRGEPFAESRGLFVIDAEAVRLDELRTNAVEDLAAALLARGDATRAVEVLRPAVERTPARESLTAPLMVALYRTGRQSDALRAFTALAHTLDSQGVEPSPELRQLEEQVLLQDPVLDWSAAPEPAVAVPTVAASSRFVGRRDELATLADAAEDASRQRRLVVVSGPAGIGKSALVHRFVAERVAHGARAAVGRCHEVGGVEYGPFAELLGAWAGELDALDDAIVRHDLAQLAPEALGPVEGDGALPAGDRMRLFESFVRAVAALGGDPPVIVLEDVHWIDRASLHLLRFVLRSPELTGLLVVVTVRDGELGPNEDLQLALDRLVTEAGATSIPLAGLTRDEVDALLRTMAPARALAVVGDLSDTIARLSRGNPLFVRELLREAIEAGTDDVRSHLERTAPRSVIELVRRRALRLSTDARHVLEIAAVAGDELDVDLLSIAVDRSDLAILDAIDEAIDSGLLAPPAPPRVMVTFSHAYVRNGFLADIDDESLELHHAAVATAIEASGAAGRMAQYASHLLSAGDSYAERAVGAARAAGDEAMEHYAADEAAQWYGRAVEHARVGDERVLAQLQYSLGRALAAVGLRDVAGRAFIAAATCARAVGDSSLLADIAVANLGPIVIPVYDAEQVGLVDEALDRVGREDLQRRVALLNCKAMIGYFSDPRAEEDCVMEADRLGRDVGGKARGLAFAMRHRWLGHFPERLDERLAAARQSFEFGLEADPGDATVQRERHFLSELLQAGRLDEFDRALGALEQRATAWRSPLARYNAVSLRATQACFRGDLARSEQLANAACALGERHEIPDAAGAQMLHLVMVRYQQGRLAELPPGRQRAAAPTNPTPAGYALAALALAETGHPSGARDVLDHLLADPDRLPRDPFWLAAVALAVGSAAVCGATDHLRWLRSALNGCRGQVVVFGTGGAVLGVTEYWEGLAADALGDRSTAEELLAQATCDADRLALPFWRGEAEIATLRMQVEVGDRAVDEIEDVLADVVARSEEAGFDRTAATARRLMTIR